MKTSARKRRLSPRLTLTDRDRSILVAVERFRLLTREQLQSIVNWNCTSKINLRLLDRRFMPVRYGMAPAVYVLGPDGVLEVSRLTGANADRLGRNRSEDRYLSDRLLSHALSLNDFAALLYSGLRRSDDADWQEWLNERELMQKCHIPGEIEGAELKPDGFVRYRLGRFLFNAFIELDTGSEPTSRLQRKLDTYWEFKDSGRFGEAFRQQGFRVLIVTLSANRAINLASKLQTPGDIRIFIGSLSDLAKDVLFGPHWFQPGSADHVCLHSPPTNSEGRKP
jgi:hypothetical protein